MLTTSRNEIANCQEVAYDSLPLKDAGTLLFFESKSELLQFADQASSFPHHFTSIDLQAIAAEMAGQHAGGYNYI